MKPNKRGFYSQTHDIRNRPRVKGYVDEIWQDLPLNKTKPDVTPNQLVNEASNNPGAFFLEQKHFFIIGDQDCIEILHQSPGKQGLIPTQIKNEALKKLQTFFPNQGSRLCIKNHSQTHNVWNQRRVKGYVDKSIQQDLPLNETEPGLTPNQLVNETPNNPGAFLLVQNIFLIVIGAQNFIEILNQNPGQQDFIPTQIENEPFKKLQTFLSNQGSRLGIKIIA